MIPCFHIPDLNIALKQIEVSLISFHLANDAMHIIDLVQQILSSTQTRIDFEKSGITILSFVITRLLFGLFPSVMSPLTVSSALICSGFIRISER